MRVNLDIPDEANEKRKTLGLTWREVIMKGLQGQDSPNKDPALESYLRSAIKSLSETYQSGSPPGQSLAPGDYTTHTLCDPPLRGFQTLLQGTPPVLIPVYITYHKES